MRKLKISTFYKKLKWYTESDEMVQLKPQENPTSANVGFSIASLWLIYIT